MLRKNNTVSVIIVYYQNLPRLINCLDSLALSDYKNIIEVIVVNNSKKSLERLKAKYKNLRIIKTPKNVGYGAGNNIGAKNAKGEYLFILNPDTKVFKNTIPELLSAFTDTNLAINAPTLLDRNNQVFPKQGTQILNPLSALASLTFLNHVLPKNKIAQKYWLSNLNKDGDRYVGVVPGSAFMIKKSVFAKVGGFDEKFFMYFEESDLCKRIYDQGYKIMMSGKSKAIHYWDAKKGKSKKLQNYFTKSRFYYFKKHFGILSASMVEVVARLSRVNVQIFFDLAFFTLLSFLVFGSSRLGSFHFSGEVGHNLLELRNAYLNGVLPLLGPPTSHPWLSFGPLYYWMLLPIWLYMAKSALSVYVLGILMGTLTVLINYVVVRKIVNTKVARISSLLMTLSPLFISFAESGRFFYFTVFISYLFLISLHNYYKGIIKSGFLVGFVYGLFFNFHYSPLFLLPVIAFVIGKKRTNRVKHGFTFLFGSLLSLLSFLLADVQNKFTMIKNLALWVPYRVAGFVGVIDKNNADAATLKNTLDVFITLPGRSFTPQETYWPLIAGIVVIIGVAFYRKYSELLDFFKAYLLAITACGFLATLVLGDAPLHYLLPIFPVPILLVSYVISETKSWKWITLGIALFMAFSTFNFQDSTTSGYRNTLVISQFVFGDAEGQRYYLKRLGEGDEFAGNFAQNYQYQLWLLGNEPASVGVESGNLGYLIDETETISDFDFSYNHIRVQRIVNP